MVKKLLIFLMLFQSFLYAEKCVIGCMLGTGFIWNFLIAINHIMWAERENKIPVIWWDETSPYFQKGRNKITKNV